MKALSTTARFDRAFFADLADYLVVAVAAALPWSTTATGIFIVAWLLVLLPTLDLSTLRRELLTPAGGLPVALCFLGAVGMFWADVDWFVRFAGLGSFIKLLIIPLLLMQFRRSAHGDWVIYGFLISCALVLLASFCMEFTPGPRWDHFVPGIPVHDSVFQGSEFLICGFGALGYTALKDRRDWRMSSALIALGALFFLDFAFAVISRISLIVAPIFVFLLGWRLSHWRGILGACIAAIVISLVAWAGSPSLRERLYNSMQEIDAYRASDTATSIGAHTAFLKESLTIIGSAPFIGHGTGSIPEQFRQITAGESGAAAVSTVNPHNQTFAVAIQIGLVGALVLWAMWISHLLLFRGESIMSWFGMLVVVENIVSSAAHSHLFDFNNGWLYVFGVGVLGGSLLRQRDAGEVAPPA